MTLTIEVFSTVALNHWPPATVAKPICQGLQSDNVPPAVKWAVCTGLPGVSGAWTVSGKPIRGALISGLRQDVLNRKGKLWPAPNSAKY